MRCKSLRIPRCGKMLVVACSVGVAAGSVSGAAVQARYYAYPAVHDSHGVLAPWYRGQNGQIDFRVRIAAETLKRYPWAVPDKVPSPAPEYMYSGAWKIAPDGAITVPPINDWTNGDLGQRAAYVLGSLIDYYRYSGDPAAAAHIAIQADLLLEHGCTAADHPWPNMLISVPLRGKPYGKCDPRGWIQLDIAAEVGIQMVRASQLCGNARWFEAAKHWGDLLAEKQNRKPGRPPWSRYANPELVPWEDNFTGGVAFMLEFFDTLIRAGYTGRDNAIVEARGAAVAYLRDTLLPNWLGHETWGRNYWDWPCPVQVENVTEFVVRYLIDHPDEFPLWQTDARNILTLFLNRTGAAPTSAGNTFSGAWAYPESSGCCGRSLWYGPLELAPVYAQYAERAQSDWAREMARRQMILATYDCHETGVVEDGIDGGPVVAGDWFKIAHPMALRHTLAAIAWMPDVFGAARENHIVRSSSVVTSVEYGDGRVAYSTVAAPAGAIDVLRLSFSPTSVVADGKPLTERKELGANGYSVRRLSCGDAIVELRHDGAKGIVVSGDDPQSESVDACLDTAASDAMTFAFEGNQVRLVGDVGPDGGLADVYLDDQKQRCGIDFWSPTVRTKQIVWYRNGLKNEKHTIRVAATGKGNSLANGTRVRVRGVQWSAATGDNGFGEGGGPTGPQRFIFGYPGRSDLVDSAGNAWRPATEFIIRSGDQVDTVAKSWWTNGTRVQIDGTDDADLYRYGVHGGEFWTDFTVGPGTYYARIKLAESRNVDPKTRTLSIGINGKEVVSAMDIAATAASAAGLPPGKVECPTHVIWSAGMYRAVDLVFNGIAPQNGIISIRFTGPKGGEAIVQAIEIGPGEGGRGAVPVGVPPASQPVRKDENLLRNGGFEDGVTGDLGAMGKTGGGNGWTYVLAGARQAYIWAESEYAAHPDWGLPKYHSGKQALRTHADGNSHTIVYQDVAAKPKTKYVASAWIRADDLHGKGFGAHAGDSARLRIQEIDGAGAVVADHSGPAVTKAGDFVNSTIEFSTQAATVGLRFLLDTVIVCDYKEGHVTYDDCSLLEGK